MGRGNKWWCIEADGQHNTMCCRVAWVEVTRSTVYISGQYNRCCQVTRVGGNKYGVYYILQSIVYTRARAAREGASIYAGEN